MKEILFFDFIVWETKTFPRGRNLTCPVHNMSTVKGSFSTEIRHFYNAF